MEQARCNDQSIGLIVVNYYSAMMLRRSLACVAAQVLRPSQIIIIDNGDDPGALDFISDLYPGVRVIRAENIGFAAANNLAMRQLNTCDWVALLNPDAFPEPDWLFRLFAAAQKYPAVDVFSSHSVIADAPYLIDGDGDSYHFSGRARRVNHGRPVSERRSGCWVFSPCAAAAMYRQRVLLEVGGFDEGFFCYFEDVDLGFRLQLRGHRCWHVPEAIVSHVGGGSSDASAMSDFALYHGHRNLIWTYVKNMPGYLFWLFLPAHLAMNLAAIVWFAARGKGRVIVRAKCDALKCLPAVWAQRKTIQATRTISCCELIKLLAFRLYR